MTKDSGGYDQAVCVRVEEVNGCFSQTDGSLLCSEGEQAAMPLHEAPAQVVKIHCTPNGDFPHNPEPLEENLRDLCEAVVCLCGDL